MFNEKIKPSLVLTLICLITCALLVIAYEATYVDSTGVITDKMVECLDEIYGTSEGFSMIKNDDGTIFAPDGVTSVLVDENGNTAFEIITDGYSSEGIHVLIGLDNDGSLKAISFISLGETPGLGTKVRDKAEFREQFVGLTYDKLPKSEAEETSSDKKYVWGSSSEIDLLRSASDTSDDSFQLDAVTGATFSSKGMNNAVTIALTAYNEMKGDAE